VEDTALIGVRRSQTSRWRHEYHNNYSRRRT
jgi:hypothetical protein